LRDKENIDVDKRCLRRWYGITFDYKYQSKGFIKGGVPHAHPFLRWREVG